MTSAPDLTGSDRGVVRRILLVTAGMGVSTAAVVVVSAVRTKVVALDLGPEGVGVLALLQSVSVLAVLLAGFGTADSGVVEIAKRQGCGDLAGRDAARWGVILLNFGGALVGAGALFVSASSVATFLGGEVSAADVRWLSVVIAAGLVNTAALTSLRGFRQIRAMAVSGPVSAAVGTAAAVALLLANVPAVVAVLVVPGVLQAAIAWWMARRLPALGAPPSAPVLRDTMRRLLTTGSAFVVQAAIGGASILVLRVLISDRVGAIQLGFFQAAFAVADTYVGFLLTAMAADYLPRLASLTQDRSALNQAVNVQLRTSILLATPLLVLMIAASPLAIYVLYAPSFGPAADLLRLQLLGELLRLATWAVGFLLIASRARRAFIAVELLHYGAFLALTAVGLESSGAEAASAAYAISYVASFTWVLIFARRASNFRLDRDSKRVLLGATAAAALVYISGEFGSIGRAAEALVIVMTAAICVRALARSAGGIGEVLGRVGPK